MQIPAEIRKCVGFVGINRGAGPEAGGTFLVGVELSPGCKSPTS